jgi:hypothetical protein
MPLLIWSLTTLMSLGLGLLGGELIVRLIKVVVAFRERPKRA